MMVAISINWTLNNTGIDFMKELNVKKPFDGASI